MSLLFGGNGNKVTINVEDKGRWVCNPLQCAALTLDFQERVFFNGTIHKKFTYIRDLFIHIEKKDHIL